MFHNDYGFGRGQVFGGVDTGHLQGNPLGYGLPYNVGLNIGQQVPSAFGIGQQVPSAFGIGQQVPSAFGIGQQVPYAFGIGQQTPFTFGIGQQACNYGLGQHVQGTSGQPIPYNLGINQHVPAVNVMGNQWPFANQTFQQMPIHAGASQFPFVPSFYNFGSHIPSIWNTPYNVANPMFFNSCLPHTFGNVGLGNSPYYVPSFGTMPFSGAYQGGWSNPNVGNVWGSMGCR